MRKCCEIYGCRGRARYVLEWRELGGRRTEWRCYRHARTLVRVLRQRPTYWSLQAYRIDGGVVYTPAVGNMLVV
jgi:hypothetical protein